MPGGGNCGLRELASGVDALYLSGHGYLSKGFLARLEDSRLFADKVSLPVPFEIGSLTFGLAPHGWGKYRFCLDHESGRIGFSSSTRLPPVRVQPRAEFLHSLGPAGTVRHFDELLRPLVDRLGFSVARLDLFCDLEGMVLSGEDRRAFLCRGDVCTTHEAGHVCTGFSFGSRRTQRISARIYDKTAEMAAKGTDWWEVIWGDRHEGGAQVWRVEFEIGRTALRELELFHPDAVLAAAPSLWRYCTGEWLTLRTPTADTNSSRWSMSAQWQAVQAASLVQGATELMWIRQRKRASSRRRLMPGLIGYLVNLAVQSGTSDIADTVEALSDAVADDEIVRRVTFAERVRRRRAEGGYR
ncbi:MAG TPA: hypothetical protein VNG12_02170 [Acidimicrobiales bacterium]|nr:hypothetical protein [Acidimicrobiales bacterium]